MDAGPWLSSLGVRMGSEKLFLRFIADAALTRRLLASLQFNRFAFFDDAEGEADIASPSPIGQARPKCRTGKCSGLNARSLLEAVEISGVFLVETESQIAAFCRAHLPTFRAKSHKANKFVLPTMLATPTLPT